MANKSKLNIVYANTFYSLTIPKIQSLKIVLQVLITGYYFIIMIMNTSFN